MNKLKNTYIKYDKSITQNDFDLLLSGVKKIEGYKDRAWRDNTFTEFSTTSNSYFIMFSDSYISQDRGHTGLDNHSSCCNQITIKEALAILYPKEWYKDLKKGDYIIRVSGGSSYLPINHIAKVYLNYGQGLFPKHIYYDNTLSAPSDECRLATKEEAAMFEDAGKPVDVTTYKMKDKTPEFIVGKWYPYKSNYYMRCRKNHNTILYYDEYINTNTNKLDKHNSSYSYDDVSSIEVDIEKIQQYLPDGHVDKLMKNTPDVFGPKDAIKGQDYWYDTDDDGAFIGRFEYTSGDSYYETGYIQLGTDSFETSDDIFISEMCGFRKATKDESKWLQACIDKGGYISREDALRASEGFKIPEEWYIKNDYQEVRDYLCNTYGADCRNWDYDYIGWNKSSSNGGVHGCSRLGMRNNCPLITIEQFKQHILKSNANEMKSADESWCVKVTLDNRKIVEKWSSTAKDITCSVGYTVGIIGEKIFYASSGSTQYWRTLLTTKEFYAKIGHKEESPTYSVGDWVYVINANISKDIISTVQQITEITGGKIKVTNSKSTFTASKVDLHEYLRKATQSEIDKVTKPKEIYKALDKPIDAIAIRVTKDIDPVKLKTRGSSPFIPKGAITWIKEGYLKDLGSPHNSICIEANRWGANYPNEYFELVDKQVESKPKEMKYKNDFKLGDNVRITGNSNGSVNRIGDVGIITKQGIAKTSCVVEVYGRSNRANHTLYTEIELVSRKTEAPECPKLTDVEVPHYADIIKKEEDPRLQTLKVRKVRKLY